MEQKIVDFDAHEALYLLLRRVKYWKRRASANFLQYQPKIEYQYQQTFWYCPIANLFSI